MSIGDTLIGKTVRFMVGDNEVEGIVVGRYPYVTGYGYVYKIETESGIVEHVFGFGLEENKCLNV